VQPLPTDLRSGAEIEDADPRLVERSQDLAVEAIRIAGKSADPEAVLRKWACAILRDTKQFRPPVSILAVTKRLAAEICQMDLPNTARLLYQPGRIRILANERASESERRFAIAHECGHIMFYKAAEIAFPDDENTRKGIARWGDSDRQERLCDSVAEDLLVPKTWLQRDLQRETCWNMALAQRLSAAYGVTLEIVLRRLVAIGLPCIVFKWEFKARPGSVEKLRLAAVWESRRHSRFVPLHKPAPENSVVYTVYDTGLPAKKVEYGYYFGHSTNRLIDATPTENGVLALVKLGT